VNAKSHDIVGEHMGTHWELEGNMLGTRVPKI